MSSVKLNHALGGSTTLEAGDTASAETITLPAGNKTLLATDGDGSQLTGVGVDGIVSTANATAITIDSSENVDFSQEVKLGAAKKMKFKADSGNSSSRYWQVRNDDSAYGDLGFKVSASNSDASYSSVLELMADGRGLSQFTAKAWCRYDQTGTPSITDSHNVSSITDNGTGSLDVNFSNNLANNNYMYNQDLGQWTTSYSRGRAYVATAGTNNTKIQCRTLENEAFTDMGYASVIVFGD